MIKESTIVYCSLTPEQNYYCYLSQTFFFFFGSSSEVTYIYMLYWQWCFCYLSATNRIFGIWCHWNTFYKYQLLDFSDCPQSIHHDIFHICELYPENVSCLMSRCLADFHNIIARCCIGNEKMPFSTKVDYHSFRDDTLFPGKFLKKLSTYIMQ